MADFAFEDVVPQASTFDGRFSGNKSDAPPAPKHSSFDDVKGALAAAVPPDNSPQDPTIAELYHKSGVRGIANHQNMLMSGEQKTDPDVDRHRPNLVGEAYMNEKNEVEYKNEKGEPVTTDKTKHVMLVDPEDGKFKVFNRSEDTNETGPIAPMALGVGRLLTEGLLTNSPKSMVAAAPSLENAAMRQGVQIPNAAISGSPIAKVVSKIPFAGTPIRDAASTALGQTANRLSQLPAEASRTGEAVGAAEAGESARAGVEKWVGPTTRDKINKAYDAVDKFITPGTKGDLTKTMDEATKIEKQYSEAGLPSSKAVAEVLGPITKPGGLSYESVKLVRRRIGEMVDGRSPLPADISEGELKRLYGSLTDDLRDVVKAGGGDKAVAAWERANKYTQLVNDRRRSLTTLLGSESKGDEGLFGAIQRMAGSTTTANIKRLAETKKVLGPEWQDVASATLGRLGTKIENSQRVFDPAKWGKDYASLSDQGKDLMFGVNTPLRKNLRDIAAITSKYSTMSDLAQGGGKIAHAVSGGAGMLGLIEAGKALWETGEYKHALGLAAAALGARGVAKALSSTVGSQRVLNFTKAYYDLDKGIKTPNKAVNAVMMAKIPTNSQQLVRYNNAVKELEEYATSEIKSPKTEDDPNRDFWRWDQKPVQYLQGIAKALK